MRGCSGPTKASTVYRRVHTGSEITRDRKETIKKKSLPGHVLYWTKNGGKRMNMKKKKLSLKFVLQAGQVGAEHEMFECILT